MKKEKKHFWTKETDEAIVKWIDSKGTDNVLYLDHIYIPLLYFARFIVGKYAYISVQYAMDKEDLSQQLVSHTSSQLLTTFDNTKCNKISNWVHTVMKHHIRHLYQHCNRQKRMKDTVSIEQVNKGHYWDDESDTYFDYLWFKEQDQCVSIADKEETAVMIKWFRDNAGEHFSGYGLKMVRLILDIIENPTDHHIEKCNINYSSYICDRCNISREYFRQTVQKMQRIYEKQIEK